MKNKLIGIILFIILLAIVFTGCSENDEDDKNYTIEYDLSVKTDANNSYILFFPTTHFKNQLETPFLENHIDGDCSIENIIIDGTFLKIEANGSIQINFQYNGPDNYGWTGQKTGYNDSADDSNICKYLIYYESIFLNFRS